MPLKHDMKFGVSEVARIFNVDRDVVKLWAYRFAEYLTPSANPPKETPRSFSAKDVRVLAYVFTYWEDDPDYEAIKIGLNRESYFDEQYDDLLTSVTPIFQELPEDLDATWKHGTVVGGMTETSDTFAIAESYKLAGDMLFDAAHSRDENFELICPIIYNYRHAVELYLKATNSQRRHGHDLELLFQDFKSEVKTEFAVEPPAWLENMIAEFVEFDPASTTFRYGDFPYSLRHGEMWVDLPTLKTLMDWLATSLQDIRIKRGIM